MTRADHVVEPLRRQLHEAGEHLCHAIAHAARSADPVLLESLAIRLNGTARLSMTLRAAILAEQKGSADESST